MHIYTYTSTHLYICKGQPAGGPAQPLARTPTSFHAPVAAQVARAQTRREALRPRDSHAPSHFRAPPPRNNTDPEPPQDPDSRARIRLPCPATKNSPKVSCIVNLCKVEE